MRPLSIVARQLLYCIIILCTVINPYSQLGWTETVKDLRERFFFLNLMQVFAWNLNPSIVPQLSAMCHLPPWECRSVAQEEKPGESRESSLVAASVDLRAREPEKLHPLWKSGRSSPRTKPLLIIARWLSEPRELSSWEAGLEGARVVSAWPAEYSQSRLAESYFSAPSRPRGAERAAPASWIRGSA